MLILNIINFVILISHVKCRAIESNIDSGNVAASSYLSNVASLVDDLSNELESDHNKFTHEWAVKIEDPIVADLVAIETNCINKGLIAPFNNIYLFENPNVPRRSKRAASEHHERLVNHEKVNNSSSHLNACQK